MAEPLPKFTLDIVREFMLLRGGRCTNHDLVKQFKPFLNDPVRKCKRYLIDRPRYSLPIMVELEGNE